MRKIISKYLLGSLRAIALGGIGVYLGYHLIQGENGAIAYLLVSKEIQDTAKILALKTEKRQQLEHRVSLLRPDTVDLDMLTERSRRVLNYGRYDEVVVFYE
ncbi:MAG: septum formation initiator [Rhodospirillaceae bacterium]|mgnify:CR=1 FL=1|nr:septum formation initiator [Rhodospirillaceae bacterium]|tara:strand:- start:2106 stop:2411 length:306 start_codon:yes stop_codon:yes gene_type:complete